MPAAGGKIGSSILVFQLYFRVLAKHHTDSFHMLIHKSTEITAFKLIFISVVVNCTASYLGCGFSNITHKCPHIHTHPHTAAAAAAAAARLKQCGLPT